MKKFLLPSIAFSVVLSALLVLASSAAFAGNTPRASHAGNASTDTYFVVKIVDENKTDNKIEYKVIAAKQYKDEEKRIKDDYTQKLKEWQDVKKADATAPQPKKAIMKKIGTSYKTQTGAQKVADKLKDEEAGKDSGDEKPANDKK